MRVKCVCFCLGFLLHTFRCFFFTCTCMCAYSSLRNGFSAAARQPVEPSVLFTLSPPKVGKQKLACELTVYLNACKSHVD